MLELLEDIVLAQQANQKCPLPLHTIYHHFCPIVPIPVLKWQYKLTNEFVTLTDELLYPDIGKPWTSASNSQS